MKLAGFTNRELELLDCFLDLIEQGWTDHLNRRAANKLKLAKSTVRSRISRMKTKYEDTMTFQKDFRSYQQKFFQRTNGKFNPLSRRGNVRRNNNRRKKQ